MKGALLIAAGIMGLGLVAAPSARADDISVAIAIRPSDGKASGSRGPQSLSSTEEDAVSTCNSKHGPCVLAGSTTGGCTAVALGYAPYWDSANGSTIAVAEAGAKAKIMAASGHSGGNPSMIGLCSDGTKDGWD